eukprot:1509371-Prymnesium_polylepis.1
MSLVPRHLHERSRDSSDACGRLSPHTPWMRGRRKAPRCTHPRHPCRAARTPALPVSYTHLTLPTICSV